ncbi:thiopurine S-methyltransferase [Runella sp.]|uniref:thiopurine S-methyltransferase n=1 Tax=Runella sp. TaxID=1960881 RepID=UPI003D0C8FF8
MEAAFWFDSWEKGGFYTGFHRHDIHPYVLKYFTPTELRDKTVLVPLCGKSLDMMYLAAFADKVIGVEIVEKAILAFFQENNLSYTQPDANTYIAGNITVLRKDFMALTPEEVGPVHFVYDRAALVALPTSMREAYLYAIDRLTDIGTQSLVITLEYSPSLPSAPFSISVQEMEDYYGAGHFINLAESPLLMQHGMVRRWNLEFLYEHGFFLTKHTNGVILHKEEQEQAICY